MSRSISRPAFAPVLILTASVILTGCNMAEKSDSQYDDARNSFYKQAQQDLDNNNPSGAVVDYESALEANPKLTEAHYQLGHLYAEKLNDPISSIYHFQQFLKLAPTSDKADEVKALIDKESQAFAASLPNSPTQSADDYAKLQADNASLKKQVDDATATIAQLQNQLAHVKHHHVLASTTPVPVPAAAPDATAATAPTPAPTSPPVPDSATVSTPAPADGSASAPNPPAPATAADTNAAPAPTAPVAAPVAGTVVDADTSTNAASAVSPRALPLDATNLSATTANPAGGPSRTYKVVKGDSLWKIAHKMYPGDTKNGVAKIQEANKDVLGTKPLKIGQVLIIP